MIEKDVLTGKGILKGVKSTGFMSMTWKYGVVAVGIMADMKVSLDGGGLLVAYGIFTPIGLRKFPIPIRLR